MRDILTGRTFNAWKVLRPDPNRSGRQWICRCVCGREKSVFAGSLKSGASRSCGCLFRVGLAARNHRHGHSKTAEYRVWSGMKKRCHNARARDFARYGGRGIAVCDRWRSDFAAFFADVGPRPSPNHAIERIDNERGYEPGNVRWATTVEQANNKRTVAQLTVGGSTVSAHLVAKHNGLTHGQYRHRISRGWSAEEAARVPRLKHRQYAYNGQSYRLSEWAKIVGISQRTLRARVDTFGWSIERALTTPVR